ncbi:MAG TPA: ATP phosphoribosyltransferase regulatory subunit [Ruminococcaceae bacterium]|nr:ATP phosphoribosyltransferase regulatory subunit [Oscillospiraceae bacterium]
MTKYQNITPEGFHDLLFKECETRREVEERLVSLFRSHGFSEVVTPSLEFYDVFTDSPLEPECMYKLIDAHGRILVFRPDNTTPIARVVSSKLKDFVPPLRLFYNQNVFRVSPSMSGRRDEIAQCGVELVGIGGKKDDIEAIATAIGALKSVAPGFRVELGHIGFFKTLIDSLPMEEIDKLRIRKYIDSKNYAALHAMLEPFEKTSTACKALNELPHLFGEEEVFERALKIAPDGQATESIQYLQTIYNTLCEMGLQSNIMIDLGLVQQIDYYTGIVFKGYMHGSGEPVLFGGRYDDLYKQFGTPMPATGFALNVDAVARVNCKEVKSDRADLVIFYDKGFAKAAFAHMDQLITSGLVCEVSSFDTVDDTVRYAKQKGIRRLDIVSDTITTHKLEVSQ